MQTTNVSDAAVDQAREILCRELARILRGGALTARARVILAEGRPAEARFYAHQRNEWEIQPEKITSVELAGALQAALEMLASKGHHDAYSARQNAAADYRDTDFQFHRDALHDLGDKLESELNGILFRDRHDSKKDVRRSIHSPRHR